MEVHHPHENQSSYLGPKLEAHKGVKKRTALQLHNLIAGGAERDLLGVRAISQDYLASAFLRLSLSRREREEKTARVIWFNSGGGGGLNPFGRLSRIRIINEQQFNERLTNIPVLKNWIFSANKRGNHTKDCERECCYQLHNTNCQFGYERL